MNNNKSVKRYRQFSGFTQLEFSKLINMPLSTYRQKEQGRISFSDLEKLKIKNIISKQILNVTIDDNFFK